MQTIVIVGAMANNFIKYKGYNIGKSIFEANQEKLIKLLSKVNSLGSKAVKRKIIEKNKISRKISKLSRMIQSKS